MEINPTVAAVAILRGRFAPVLAQRTVRSSQPRDARKVIALQPLSIKAIVQARHLLSMKYYRLDHLLPPPLLEEMMVSPVTRAMRTEPEYLRLLLSSTSRSCYIIIPYLKGNSRQQYPRAARTRACSRTELDSLKKKLDDFANLILGTAKERIRSLEFDADEDEKQRFDPTWICLVRDLLHRLLDGLSDLHELSVLHCPGVVTDQTLGILTEKHNNLTMLAVRCTERFSDDISKYSFRRLASRCSQLENLDVSGLRVKEEGYAAMLPHIPNLATLTTSDPEIVGRVVYNYARQEPPPPPLKFDTAIRFDTLRFRSNQDRNELFRRTFSAAPNVTNVSMHTDQQICTVLAEAENKIETLDLLISGGQVSLETQSTMMENFSPSLTTLTIKTFSSWDLGVTAQHCHDLKHLKLQACISVNTGVDFEVEEGLFANLVTCSVSHHKGWSVQYPNLTIPAGLVHHLFSSPHLREISLCCVEIPGDAVMDVCERANREERGVLSSLESLYLGNIRGMNSEHVIALMCAAPRLTEVELVLQDGFLDGQELGKVQLFCHGSLPDVFIRFAWADQEHRRYHFH